MTKTKDQRQRSEIRGHMYELWSRRRFAGWIKTAANKLMCRRVERRTAKHNLRKGPPT